MKHKTLFDKSTALDMSRFTVAEQKKHEYEHYVDLTAKLIKRPYFQTHKMVENWPISKIKERYQLCTKHKGDMPGDAKWFWLRKRELSNNET